MDLEVRLVFPGCTEGQFLMRSMHGIARLKGHDLAPSELSEAPAKLGWRIAKQFEIVVNRWLHAPQLAPDVNPEAVVEEKVDPGVGLVSCSEDRGRFRGLVRSPDVLDLQGTPEEGPSRGRGSQRDISFS